MKLNYKRTILVGFAFFLISAFWQAYDAIVPLILTNHYGLSQTLSGAVMSFDNVLAVFLLPIFGAISDKVNTKWGRRTPFIFVGTILAVVAFVLLTFIDNYQLSTVVNNTTEMNYEAYTALSNSLNELTASIGDGGGAAISEILARENSALMELALATDIPSQYGAADALRKSVYDLMAEARLASDAALVDTANLQLDLVDSLFGEIAEATFAITAKNVLPLIGFIAMLLVVLVSMATFRSPAVALMPDVTVKPLRSKGNAIINLMGTAGGIIVLVFGMIFSTKEIYMQYTWYVVAVCAVMLTGLGIFIFTVKEKLWASEMAEQTKKLEAEQTAAAPSSEARKLSKEEFRSLLLILASVALWYVGYNSITSKYSVYATRELGFDYNLTLIIAQAAAVVAYIPVGIISSKFGRRKTILAGIIMLASAFLAGNFITPLVPEIVMYPIFILAGIGWATINVNSFPMVVELSRGGDVGKYTGYYYTASMAAQIVAPNLSGILYDLIGMRKVFFIFGTVFVALSFLTMFFVKHGDAKAERVSALEALAGAEDD